jgi:hypothetical protein
MSTASLVEGSIPQATESVKGSCRNNNNKTPFGSPIEAGKKNIRADRWKIGERGKGLLILPDNPVHLGLHEALQNYVPIDWCP